MRPREAVEVERPFPGARPAVPGMHRLSAEGSAAEATAPVALPLENLGAALGHGWVVRLPVRAEQVAVDRQVVVYERVVVRRHEMDEVARVAANVRREELKVDVEDERTARGGHRL